MKRRSVIILVVVGCLLVLLSGLFRILCGVLVDYWWFGALGYAPVYTRILFTKIGLWWLGFAVAFGATACGFLLAQRVAGPRLLTDYQWRGVSLSLAAVRTLVNAVCWSGAVVVGLIGGSASVALWHRVLLFLNRVPFDSVDPIFGHNIGFYVFVFPLAVYVRGMLQVLAWVSLVAAALYYLATGTLVVGRTPLLPRRAFSHLSKTAGLIFVLVAAGYFLDRYALLYSTQGVSFGAGYTDVHARLPACWVMVAASLGVSLVFFAVGSAARLKLMAVSVAVWAGCLVLAQGLAPQFLQWARVGPNELRLEQPYIANTITQTRKAYKLDAVREVQYPVKEDLRYEEVLAEHLTIKNVRLWDWRPLRQTYRQLQAIRSYYDFNDVDVDRYELDGSYTQALLSVRELRHDKLPPEAQTWINLRLQYTHGYGLCLSPVNESTEDGLPVLIVKDIPPQAPPELELQQPRIYYGQSTSDYVFVSTGTEEFDYPMGDRNVRRSYDGGGGVRMDGFWRKLVFALQFRDMKILLSSELVEGSRVMFRRLISGRIARVAPYLLVADVDLYPVVHDGRIYWMQDAYTRSSLYPYSEPARDRRLNYIRNSVKVVVDAYEGDMTFYVADETDPLVQAYAKMFPEVYRPISEMPPGLRKHVRYPLGLFGLQAAKYATFHMRDPQTFYNQEDPWEVAMEEYGGQKQRVESYYIVMRLADSETAEFLVMLPFTPKGKDNMIAWLAGRCDGDHYGELVAYMFPKGKVVSGPLQVENWIDQDPDISQQLTLWGQGGSSVIRGNLLVIPIAGGILYVEPLYIRAAGGGVPQLKRVITAYGMRVAMAPNLAESLRALFGKGVVAQPEAAPEEAPPEPPALVRLPDEEARALLQGALDHYSKAQQALREADWQQYGLHMQQMKAKLDAVAESLSQAQGS